MARNFICSIPRGTQLTTIAPPPTGVTGSMCQNDSWVYFGGQCYFFSPEDGPTARQTWYEARRTCLSMQSDLVSVHSVDENGFLTSTMSRHSPWVFWTGLNDLDHNGYSWTNGEPVNFVSWRINEPDDAFGGESCVESTSKGEWNDDNCQDKNGYICKRPVNGFVTQQTTPIQPVTGGCPISYVTIPLLSKCYKLAGLTDDTRKNFTDAITACSQMMPPSTLVSIHNYIEQTYLMTLTANLPHYVWIGLNDMKRRNYFEWHDNSEVDFTHWGGNQPDENLHSNNPDDRRDCVGINTQGRNAGNWNDMACRNRNHYICQVPRVPTAPTQSPLVSGCPTGYTKHRSNCYKFHPIAKTWSSAQIVCRNEKALLATFANRFQLNIVSLLRRPDRQHMWKPADIWLGLTMTEGTTRFQWINNWPVRFTRWANGEPSNNGTCVKMNAKNFWYTQPCNAKNAFVCQISLGGPPPTTSTVSGVCPDSTWQPYGEYCYQMSPSKQRSWNNARYACSMQGGSLASVHSQKEMDFVTGLFSSAVRQGADSSANVWIGLSKGFSDGFSWADGSEVEYDNWDDGEPSDTDNGLHQDCVQADLSSGKWNDVDCFDSNYCVCKMLQEVKTTPIQYGTTQRPNARTVTPGPGKTQPVQNPVTPKPYTPWAQRSTATPYPQTAGPQGPGMATQNQFHRGGQPTHYPVHNTPQSQTQTGGGSSGLSGGGVAGIVLGTVAIIAIAAVAIFFLRGRFSLQPGGPLLSSGSGFDNALYSKANEGGGGKDSVSFGSNMGASES